MWIKDRERAGGWRKFYNQGLYNVWSSPNIFREDNVGGA
jgi:hypothetical protein